VAIELAVLLLAILGFAYCASKTTLQLPTGGAALTLWCACIFGMLLLAVGGALAFQILKTYLSDVS